MWYWIVMVLLVIGCAALLGGTFASIKKNKAEAAGGRRRRSRRYPDEDEDDYDDDGEEEYEPPRRRASQRRQAGEQQQAQRPRQKKRRQWKIILEDLDTWEKYSFVFYDTVGIGRGRDGSMYEKYLPIPSDARVSKAHCVIIHRGDKLYLKDEDSRNGTFLNGRRIDRPIVIQKDDVIGVGETKLEVQRILRESE